MKASELITRLSGIVAGNGDVEVILHVTNGENGPGDTVTVDALGNVTNVTFEQEHGDAEAFFIRISGDDEE